jgi:uncharacterized membrane protein YkvA (DUF1232 family)
VTTRAPGAAPAAVQRGRLLELATLAWNVVGVIVVAIAAWRARSVALAGFGLDSLIEIGASTVVLWELSDTSRSRQRRALRLIAVAFSVLGVYLTIQATVVLSARYHPHHSPLGIGWTGLTAVVMFGLAAGKASTGRELENPVLVTEGRAARGGCPRRPGAQHRAGLVVGRSALGVRPRLLRGAGSQRDPGQSARRLMPTWAGILVAVAAALVLVWVGFFVMLSAINPDESSVQQAARLLPDVLRLISRLARDRTLPRGVRLRLWLLLGYLLSPIDIVPDFIPVIGYADDLVVVALVLRSTVRAAGVEAVRAHWPGTPDGFAVLQRLTGTADGG